MSIGERLRAAREAQGLSLEEAAEQTRIKRVYLEALESEAFAAFPSPAHARGFLRRYARWLGLDEAALVAEWDGLSAAVPPPRPARMPSMFQLTRIPTRPAFPGWRLAGLGLAFALALVLIGLAWAHGIPRLGAPPPGPTLTRPLPSAGAGPTLPPVGPAPGLRLEAEAQEHVWVRILADGQVVYQGLLRPGEVRTWEARGTIQLDTGNAAALQVSVNGLPQGPLGGRGEIVRKTWRAPAAASP